MLFRHITQFFINPFLYLYFGILILFFLKNHRKKYIFVLIIYLYVITIPLTAQLFINFWQLPNTFKSNQIYDAVVPLAGASDMDLYVSAINNPTKCYYYIKGSTNMDRLLSGLEFIKNGNAKILLLGDWRLVPVTKQQRIKTFASALHLKESQFDIYGWVGRTLDEARGVNLYVNENSFHKILLVTTALHMRRSYAMFRKQGLDVDIFSVNRKGLLINWTSFVPSIKSPEEIYVCLYELFGYLGYYLKGDIGSDN
ncbi:MAG: YdcF family protein [Nitrospirae bacterium]|nr:YdcF family protein [Nitrospirota bacterium]MBF0541651.1 YdcF family protein [Nitrospirota bacterium]